MTTPNNFDYNFMNGQLFGRKQTEIIHLLNYLGIKKT